MKNKLSNTSLAIAVALGALTLGAGSAAAQVAGSSTAVGVSIVEATQVAPGWSVKKTLLGKTVYNEAGQKVGKVQDLIIAPDRNVSLVIVGAGGFIGIGRHDVAVPVSQIQNQAGKLVMAGASKESVKALPAFDYAVDTSQRDRFIASAEQDIAKGKAQAVVLEKKAGAATAEAKARLEVQRTALQGDVQAAEAKLTELKQATAQRWKDFEGSVSTATAKLRKSLAAAVA
jgi:sporulation protein YlmC with PRC-barrel domain